MKKIIDEFTSLKVSRQRKWQLRHPRQQKILLQRFRKTPKRRIYIREHTRKCGGHKKRYLGAASYSL